ncbi:MAG TPA: pyrroline-5-carboxylate reductase dimerization domain-containing protein, partial [Candidatus Limnocylindria bacterium]|nr:pyrroline-5-carboxylate reductase dimerization domain-containing protein [Candidatus Limnocylindria bacterium]
AVKPQQMEELLRDIKPEMRDGLLVISLTPGKKHDYYADHLGGNIPVILSMPNINAKIGASVTALCPNGRVTPEMLEDAKAVFTAVGSVTVIAADKMTIFSALGGAAPAFVYMFIDALATAGVKYGMPRGMAQQVACDMLEGSAQAVRQSGEHPRAMMDQVTSPGGTTIEGVHRLAALGFEHAVHEAVRAVIEKTEKLEGK